MAYSLLARGTGSPELVSRQLDMEIASYEAGRKQKQQPGPEEPEPSPSAS
jgi:multidrug efflux pump